MELDFQIDTSWCPVCNRHILPKRYQVQLPPPQQPQTSPPPPPSPTTQKGPNRKNGTIRARGGLVHGTGRVKPNGTIKRSDSKKSRQSSSERLQQPPAQPPVAVKTRTVIDQGPTPLYCSDECRLADLNASFGAFSIDFNPDQQSPPMPPVPHNSLSVSPTSESDTSSSFSDSDPPTTTSLCHAALAPIYGFPPLPPAPHISQTVTQDQQSGNNYQSGVMMAAKRIKDVLCPEVPKRSSIVYPNQCQQTQERKPIPGWTDGSDAWRASVYSLSAPRDPAVPNDPDYDDRRAYKSFVASSHRAGGVYSTLDTTYQVPTAVPPTIPCLSRTRTVEELYSKYPLALPRRSESRASMPVVSLARSLPTSVGPIVNKKKEVSLLKRGVEGKLVVPSVKLKVSTSYVSVAGSSSNIYDSYQTPSLVRRDSEFSDGSMSSVSEEDEDIALPSIVPQRRSRSVADTQSWSYDNILTYPIMQLPPKKEKRREMRVINGIETEVEFEVELPAPPLKRLFLFPGKQVR